MKKSVSTTANLFSSYLRTGLFGLLFCLMIGVWYSCKKEGQPSKNTVLTISKARVLFEKSGAADASVASRDESEAEEGDGDIHIILDWENATEYRNEIFDLNVVEVPILHSGLSSITITGDSQNSSAIGDGQSTYNVIFVQDSNGVINAAAMKISGTPNYSTSHDIESNSFQSIDENFEGRVAYYNFSDSLLRSYLVKDGNVFETVTPTDTGQIIGATDRWAWCVDWFECIPCSVDHHDCDQMNICKCVEHPGPKCVPPQLIVHLVECGGPMFPPPFPQGQGPNSNNPIIPPPNNNWPFGGGSSNNNNNIWSQFDDFLDCYAGSHNGEQLLNDEVTEEIAQSCFADLAANHPGFDCEDFEDCVDEQKECECTGLELERKQIGSLYPFAFPFNLIEYKVIAVMENKNCKTGGSNSYCELEKPGWLPDNWIVNADIIENHGTRVKGQRTSPCHYKVIFDHWIKVRYSVWIGPVEKPQLDIRWPTTGGNLSLWYIE